MNRRWAYFMICSIPSDWQIFAPGLLNTRPQAWKLAFCLKTRRETGR